MKTASHRFSICLRTLHWVIAALLSVNIGVGLYLGSQDGTAPEAWYDRHKGVGVVIWSLVILRIAWRIAFEDPLAQLQMPLWQQFVARANHFTLYCLMALIPLTGYLSSSAAGYPTHVFGLVTIPPLTDENRQAYDLLRQTHRALNYTFMALIGIHLAAVVRHRVTGRNDLLSRML